MPTDTDRKWNYLLPVATTETNKIYRGSHRLHPKQRGNRIFVAKGNNWIQYGSQIKNRGKLTDCAQSRQEVELLVARGNN